MRSLSISILADLILIEVYTGTRKVVKERNKAEMRDGADEDVELTTLL